MTDTARHDAWSAGDSYEAYMGRWSRRLAPRFLDWLDVPAGLDWLDVGCGTGALSAAILERAEPASLVAVDPSAGFVEGARATLADPRAEVRVGDAQALELADASRDVVVSGLVLNFVPDRPRALAEMRRVARPGGWIAFYVWDYPGGSPAFLAAFWEAAAAVDPSADALAEARRFADCTADGLTALATAAGLGPVHCAAIEVPTVFADFDDLWRPFTLGAGPAPGYVASLDPAARERLRGRLEAAMPRQADGTIALTARAWGLKTRLI